MANIGMEFRKYVVAQSGVSALISTRMYPDELPQNAQLPAVRYRVINSAPAADLADGDANFAETVIEVACYADTQIAAHSVANAIRKGVPMQGFKGTMGGIWVYGCHPENAQEFRTDPPTDGSDKRRYIIQHDYRIASTDPAG